MMPAQPRRKARSSESAPRSIALVTGTDLPFAPPDDAPLLEALRALGPACEIVAWSDPTLDWSRFDLAVLRSTWDYDTSRDAFLDWLDRVSARVRVVNDAETVRWNSHKSYLLDLASHGVPVVPTELVTDATGHALSRVADGHGWAAYVVKPAVAVGAHGLRLVDAENPIPDEPFPGDWLVQPFVESVRSDGETSLAAVDGRVTHAWRKLPREGDIRVQEEYGGTYEIVDGGPWEGFVEEVLSRLPRRPVIARVDVMVWDGRVVLSELEVIEPQLLLDRCPSALDLLARTLAGLVA